MFHTIFLLTTMRFRRSCAGLCAALVLTLFLLLFSGCPTDPGRGGTRAPVPDLKREVFFINGLAETLSIINPEAVRNPGGQIAPGDYVDTGESVDLTKKRVYNDVLVVGKWPNHILAYDGKLYVTSSGENIIEVYDESTFAWRGKIDLGTNSNPWMVVRKPGTAKGYIPNFVAGDVAVVDLDTFEVLERIDAGQGPEGAVYYNGYLYVCNTHWNYQIFGFERGTVTVIDTANDAVVETIDIENGYTEGEGCNPQSAVAIPSLDEVHIICTGDHGSHDGAIVILDADPGSGTFLDIKARSEIGGSPIYSEGSIDTSRGLVYLSGVGGVSSYAYTDPVAGVTLVITASDPAGDFYAGTVYDPAEDILFAASFTYDEVIAVDPADGSELAVLQGSDGPQSPVLVVE